MVKLSISLPNGAQVALESDDPDIIYQFLGMVLPGLIPDATAGASATLLVNGHGGAGEKGTDATPEHPPVTPQSNGVSYAPSANGFAPQAVSEPPPPAPAENGALFTAADLPANEPEGDGGLLLEAQRPESLEDFTVFCQAVNPTGDMRRVVVAAEGATRFFGADGVNADELGELFDLAGWRRANDFTQTIRNAARSKFRWLERLPGRTGRYAPTERGREITLTQWPPDSHPPANGTGTETATGF